MRVNTMYGADGKLRTSYLEGKAAEAAKKNVKAFNRELARYEKDFTNYASLDIDSANVARTSTRYIFGKLNIAEKYIDYIPAGDMAQSMGDDMTAIAGNKSAFKLGVGSKIASVFQPFFEKQAAKHPKLQVLSDNITKAANGGRMPLTADSAAVMKIAFDKKYYNDVRRPGVDKDELKAQYDSAISNLMTMAAADGVDRKAMSAKMSEKLIQQMQIDESITDIYAGMADGGVRLGEDKPMLNAKGEPITIKGKTLYQRSNNFVDKDGNEIDALSLSPREPQTIDEILSDYQAKLDKYAKSCKTEADFKKMLASDSYQNIERNAKVFAALDCPDEAEKFKYDFSRVNIESCRNWAIENDNKSPYAQLVVPPKFDEITAGNEFVRSYATSDYYNIDGIEDDYYTTDISGQAQDEIRHMSDDELADSLKKDVVDANNKLSDIEMLQERLDRLEAENRELRAQLYPDDAAVDKEKQPSAIAGIDFPITAEAADDITNEPHGDIGLQSPSLNASVRSEDSIAHSDENVKYSENKERAEDMLHSTGLQLPKENTYLRSEDSIAHSDENVKYPEQNISELTDEENILKMAEKIQQNNQENKMFSEALDRFLDETKSPTNKPILIGDTPNALTVAGADAAKPLIIRPATIVKAMGNSETVFHGHGLSKDIMKQLSSELRNPVLILKGSHDESLVAVTELDDKNNDKVIVPVELNSKDGRHEVNRITSAYGKENIANYLNTQVYIKHNLIACNKEKADKMFQSLGLQLPPEETFISFDNSIAYSTANVKYPEKNISELTQGEYAVDKSYPESQPVVGTTDHTASEEKKSGDYSVFRIESMGEVAYFRDNGIDIDGFLNRFAEIEAKTPVKYYDFVKDCQKITEIEYAESEQSRKNPPAFSADINLDDREFIVHKGNQFANVSLDDAIKSVKETGKANLEFEEFDYDYEDIDTETVDADERSFDEILMDSSELHGAEYTSDSAVDKPNVALSSKTEEKDAVSDAAKPSEIVSRIGNYIGIGQRGREAFQEFKQRISEQFGSSGGTILPSNQNKRDYTVKPVEISSEYDSAKYIEAKPVEPEPTPVSEPVSEPFSVSEQAAPAAEPEPVTESIEPEIPDNDSIQSNKPAEIESSVNSAISRFSDTVIGYDESMDDYTDDDADFSP